MMKLRSTTSCDSLIWNENVKLNLSRDEEMEKTIRFCFLSPPIPAPTELTLNEDDGPEHASRGLSLFLTDFRRTPEALRHSCREILTLTAHCACYNWQMGKLGR